MTPPTHDLNCEQELKADKATISKSDFLMDEAFVRKF